MKRYILLTYSGDDITPEVISTLGEVLLAKGVTTENVHGISMGEDEVCSVLVKHTTKEAPRELSPVESACIYAKKRFGVYFDNKLKLSLAISKAVLSDPNDKALTSAIRILAHGVSTSMSIQYGITKEIVLIFRQISQNLESENV